jgi:hypothetical protein
MASGIVSARAFTEPPGSGSGSGSGYGDGSGSGSGSGYGYGYGYGDGSGYGYGDGYGDGYGEVIGHVESHSVVLVWPGVLRVGCTLLTASEWREQWKDLARTHRVTVSEAKVQELLAKAGAP